ncbi:MAG: tRNA pseudouridine(55) synthase TruB [Luteitalea sp.]
MTTTGTLDGVLVVDKPEGMTSHDVVAAVRRRLPRGTRVGHTGTLDPLASGVLALVIGKATRLSQFLTAGRKRYNAIVQFGSSTTTDDRAGDVVAIAPTGLVTALDEGVIRRALATRLGTHPQVPPAHSAKKIGGQRAYELARRGGEVDLPPVSVTAFRLDLTRWDPDAARAVVELDTSAGYYVRSLARELGEQVGVPAHLAALRRTASSEFTLEQSRPLDELLTVSVEALTDWCLPLGALLPSWPAVVLTEAQQQAAGRGQVVALEPGQDDSDGAEGTRVRLLDQAGTLLAVARLLERPVPAVHADIVLLPPAPPNALSFGVR